MIFFPTLISRWKCNRGLYSHNNWQDTLRSYVQFFSPQENLPNPKFQLLNFFSWLFSFYFISQQKGLNFFWKPPAHCQEFTLRVAKLKYCESKKILPSANDILNRLLIQSTWPDSFLNGSFGLVRVQPILTSLCNKTSESKNSVGFWNIDTACQAWTMSRLLMEKAERVPKLRTCEGIWAMCAAEPSLISTLLLVSFFCSR